MIKHWLFSVARSEACLRFVARLEQGGGGQNSLLRVLTYHRVDELHARTDLDPRLISATPGEFTLQMKHLAANYRVVDIDQLLRAVSGGPALPPRAVLLTFDDAYRDFAKHAWPVLKQYRLPAVVFVPTAYPDVPQQAFWWDRLYQALCHGSVDRQLWRDLGFGIEQFAEVDRYRAYRAVARQIKQLPHERAVALVDQVHQRCDAPPSENPVMGWDELRRLAAAGVSLAPHTRTHPLMNRIPEDQAVAEATESHEDLQREIPGAKPVLAYPGGAFTGNVARRLRDENFQLGFTTCRGINDLRSADPLRLRRINVGRGTPPSLLRAQLLAGSRHLNFCWPIKSAV